MNLRAPLRSIDGFSQALLEDYNDKLDDEARQYLRYLRESAQADGAAESTISSTCRA